MRYLALLITLLLSPQVWPQQPVTLTIDKDWGLQLGDKIHVQLTWAGTTAKLDRSSLPEQHERYGNWLYLDEIQARDSQLDLVWQVMNVPEKNKAIPLPKFDFRLEDDTWLAVPDQTVMIGPALAISTETGQVLVSPKPAYPPVLLPTQSVQNTFWWSLTFTVVFAGILWIWHIGWHPRQRRPFAQALHDLRMLPFKGKAAPEQAIRIFHAAFNQTAGTVIVPEHVAMLFERAPWLEPLQAEIQAFYQESARYFFSPDQGQLPDIKAMKKLVKACRAREKLA